jgi:CxxC-x17-CxxC domain-containing protein
VFKDRALKCEDCGCEFTFTAGEQQFYAEKGFTNEPTRCSICKATRKLARNTEGKKVDRPIYTVKCGECGLEFDIPFKPRPDRPVYCRDCFQREG